MRRIIALTTALALSLALVSSAAAAVVSSAGFTDQGSVLVAVGTVDGLDPSMGAQVNLGMAGTATVTCITPTDAVVKTGISVSQQGPAKRLAPGESVFDVTTYVPQVTAQNAGCPAGTLFVVVNDVRFTRAVITVIQGGVVEMFGYQNVDGSWRPV